MTGLENKRRDNCALTREVMDTVQRDILINRNVENAVQHIRDMIENVRMLRYTMDKFVITKGLSRKAKDYVNPQPQQVLVKRLATRRREMGNKYVGTSEEYRLGDRVPYVIIASGRKELIRNKVEDPLYAVLNNVPLDIEYYVDHMIVKPLSRLCEPLVVDPDKVGYLFDHTIPIASALASNNRQKVLQKASMVRINKGAPCTSTGTIGRFLVRMSMPCLNCGASIPCDNKTGVSPALCDIEDCRRPNVIEKARAMVESKIAECQRIEKEACHQCAKLGIGDSVDACANTECPNIFIRIKAVMDAKKHKDTLKRFQ